MYAFVLVCLLYAFVMWDKVAEEAASYPDGLCVFVCCLYLSGVSAVYV